MKRIFRLFLVVCLSLFVLVGCNTPSATPTPEFVDYVSQVKLTRDFTGKDFVTEGIGEVTLYNPVDGDTIHVLDAKGKVLKLRFNGVDTPESTAQVEAWGVPASNFTKNIVKNAKSIVIATDDGKAGSNTMDTYERYLCWVWYKMDDASDYRLLNLELVQEGYSVSKNASVINYKQEFISAATQARQLGLRVWGEVDPDYCYTEAKELTLKAIVEDINANGTNSQYYLQKVIFTAQVVRISQQSTFYLNYTDPETGIVYGIQVYHRDSQTGYMNDIGVTVRLSGTLTYYETGQVFQITDVVDKLLTSKVDNIKVIEEAKPTTPTEIDGDDLVTTNKNIKFNLVSLKGLKVKSVYTTTTETSSNGAMTITCEDANGKTVSIRTDVLFDRTGTYAVDSSYKVVASNFEGKTIDVTGVVEMFNGNYQVKMVSMDDVVIH